MLSGLAGPAPAWAGAKWTEPTAEELQMKADPAAPGAEAVYLYLEQTADDQKHEHTYYARIKVLTEGGREYADVVMPYWNHAEKIRGVEGRTIHSDGTVVPFTGKPWQKELVKSGGLRIMEKGFTLPDVEVGSILEYRYMTTYDDWWAPQWYLQQPIFVHEAHYHFVPGPGGKVFATRFLPPNADVNEKKGWELRVANVPAQVDEDDSPPLHDLGYRVLFYYMDGRASSAEQYWANAGAYWSTSVDNWVAADQLKPAVAQIVAPGDSDEQKLRKIYAAVMQLENTTFTRERSEAEETPGERKAANAADVWQQRSGNRQQIALLFVGLARAAGLKVYAMRVTNRDENVFSKNETDWDQLDDLIAIVNLGGIETYFDPGERYCAFGEMYWIHTWTGGVRQVDNGTEVATTPYPVATDTSTIREADLTLDATGQVHGTIRVEMTGNTALRWREEALFTDAEEAKKEFGDGLQSEMPSGTTATMQNMAPLADFGPPLVATLAVSGTLGTKTGRRLFLPGTFFESQAKPRFATATRVNPVYLRYPYRMRDTVKMTLPPGSSAEIVPKDADIPFATNAAFTAKYRVTGNVYAYDRDERVSKILYPVADYPALRDYFQKVNTQDEGQLVLTAAADAKAHEGP